MSERRPAFATAMAFAFLATIQGSAAAQSKSTPSSDPPVELSIYNEAIHSVDLAIEYLKSTQLDDGSWGHYPALTALCATSLMRSPEDYSEWNSDHVFHAIRFIVGCAKPDGGIYLEDLAAYNTSICLMALVEADNPEYDEIIRKGRQFLIDIQTDEGEGVSPDSCFYGGIGYGKSGRPDLSNLQWSLEALKKTEDYAPRSEPVGGKFDDSMPPASRLETYGQSGKGLFWDKAILFLQRCQNLKEYNDQELAGNDGGFIYKPDESKAGGSTSYGSMTYAGMKSFIYANVGKEDPRVQAAFDWITRNYTLEKNPEMGLEGLFYYYHTMAKALRAYGDDVIVDEDNVTHKWREEFIIKLVNIQNEDGSWVNSVGRWWENNKDLVTAYCVLGLEEAIASPDEPADLDEQ